MRGGNRTMFKIFQETKTIKWIYAQKELIDFSPAYQRRGNLWKEEQQQLLIDSILNGLDIPKFYFQFMPPVLNGTHYNYAIIDGKQRIEAILGFIEDKFPLSEDFSFLDSDSFNQFENVSGKLFSEIENSNPALIARFWQYELNIVFMDTTNPDIINELFVRLNSGLSVSTSEKRNANGGILASNIQQLCNTSRFFTHKIKISNRRFEHNDLALKLLMIEFGEWDLTKKSVDNFVKKYRNFTECADAFSSLQSKIDEMAGSFDDNDGLLNRKNLVVTLYTVFDDIPIANLRPFVEYFEKLRLSVQAGGTSDDGAELSEFTRMLQQGADKKSSIQARRNIMRHYIEMFLKNN